ncbi:MAG: hypothetical protein ABS940_10805, partial [Stenotrophomonas sp.]|uniref:hypothetical protein n=1 Tax=Stenotrophomonas sp. TaxID=69392 RepID=UPI0033162F87
ADLLHAMQALSQLSYGPTMLEAEFYAAVKHSPSLFSEIPKKECTQASICRGRPLRGRVHRHARDITGGQCRALIDT